MEEKKVSLPARRRRGGPLSGLRLQRGYLQTTARVSIFVVVTGDGRCNHLASTVKSVRRHMMSAMNFSGRRFNRECRALQRIMRAPLTPARTGRSSLSNCHIRSPSRDRPPAGFSFLIAGVPAAPEFYRLCRPRSGFPAQVFKHGERPAGRIGTCATIKLAGLSKKSAILMSGRKWHRQKDLFLNPLQRE